MLRDLFKPNKWASKFNDAVHKQVGSKLEELKGVVWSIEEQANKNPVLEYIAQEKYKDTLLTLLSLTLQNKHDGRISIEDVRTIFETALQDDPDLQDLFSKTDCDGFYEIEDYKNFLERTKNYLSRLSQSFNDIDGLERDLSAPFRDRFINDVSKEIDTLETDADELFTDLVYRELLLTSRMREIELNFRNRVNHAIREYSKFFTACINMDQGGIENALNHMPYDQESLSVFLICLETVHINGQSMVDFIDANRGAIDPDCIICGTLYHQAKQAVIDPEALIDLTRPQRKTIELNPAPC